MSRSQYTYPSNWCHKLKECGHFAANFELDSKLHKLIENKKWNEIDDCFKKLTQSNGKLFIFLSLFKDFKSIEFIISIRDAKNDWEEDGIWHDDGSRKLAFSLSLNENPEEIEGGILKLRKKNSNQVYDIPPFGFGEIIVFSTGLEGFEHKINAVTKGTRIIIAGWCS